MEAAGRLGNLPSFALRSRLAVARNQLEFSPRDVTQATEGGGQQILQNSQLYSRGCVSLSLYLYSQLYRKMRVSPYYAW